MCYSYVSTASFPNAFTHMEGKNSFKLKGDYPLREVTVALYKSCEQFKDQTAS